ncbi:hypothetical protein [Chryseobacterium kimseyorum]|uniref:hypothetical protein n=1 Tax=Chryseobacterium kimseyorum TaxID=2984028 RepID=UPI0038735D9D
MFLWFLWGDLLCVVVTDCKSATSRDGYHAEEVFSNKWIKEKINYIHQNPVKQKIVAEPEHYYFSSARNYAELDNALDVFVVFMG